MTIAPDETSFFLRWMCYLCWRQRSSSFNCHFGLKKIPTSGSRRRNILHQSIMVWAAMSAKHLVGPYFIAFTWNKTVHQRTLLCRQGKFWSRSFKTWVSKFGPIPWPPLSPDLTSCDNALWGIIKSKIAAQKAANVDELKNITKMEFDKFLLEHWLLLMHAHLYVQHDGPYDVYIIVFILFDKHLWS